MKNQPEFRLPESLFVSPRVSENEITEASKLVKYFILEEMEKIRDKSKLLSFSRGKNTIYTGFFNNIPSILINNKLSIQKYDKHCRSCIITEDEVYGIAEQIYNIWKEEVLEKYHDKDIIEQKFTDFKPFEGLSRNLQKLYFEFVYIISIAFKKSGYEVIRKSEARFINLTIAEKLARVIHS
jgi:hypothetical protein